VFQLRGNGVDDEDQPNFHYPFYIEATTRCGCRYPPPGGGQTINDLRAAIHAAQKQINYLKRGRAGPALKATTAADPTAAKNNHQ
jgi:hypothetical protein